MALIMIVDDSSSFRGPTAAMLRSEGYETICASNGKEALLSLKERLPDLILLDIAMPEMDGIACLTTIRSELRTARLEHLSLRALAKLTTPIFITNFWAHP